MGEKQKPRTRETIRGQAARDDVSRVPSVDIVGCQTPPAKSQEAWKGLAGIRRPNLIRTQHRTVALHLAKQSWGPADHGTSYMCLNYCLDAMERGSTAV